MLSLLYCLGSGSVTPPPEQNTSSLSLFSEAPFNFFRSSMTDSRSSKQADGASSMNSDSKPESNIACRDTSINDTTAVSDGHNTSKESMVNVKCDTADTSESLSSHPSHHLSQTSLPVSDNQENLRQDQSSACESASEIHDTLSGKELPQTSATPLVSQSSEDDVPKVVSVEAVTVESTVPTEILTTLSDKGAIVAEGALPPVSPSLSSTDVTSNIEAENAKHKSDTIGKVDNDELEAAVQPVNVVASNEVTGEASSITPASSSSEALPEDGNKSGSKMSVRQEASATEVKTTLAAAKIKESTKASIKPPTDADEHTGKQAAPCSQATGNQNLNTGSAKQGRKAKRRAATAASSEAEASQKQTAESSKPKAKPLSKAQRRAAARASIERKKNHGIDERMSADESSSSTAQDAPQTVTLATALSATIVDKSATQKASDTSQPEILARCGGQVHTAKNHQVTLALSSLFSQLLEKSKNELDDDGQEQMDSEGGAALDNDADDHSNALASVLAQGLLSILAPIDGNTSDDPDAELEIQWEKMDPAMLEVFARIAASECSSQYDDASEFDGAGSSSGEQMAMDAATTIFKHRSSDANGFEDQEERVTSKEEVEATADDGEYEMRERDSDNESEVSLSLTSRTAERWTPVEASEDDDTESSPLFAFDVKPWKITPVMQLEQIIEGSIYEFTDDNIPELEKELEKALAEEQEYQRKLYEVARRNQLRSYRFDDELASSLSKLQ
jgi:hypothetical protein